MRCAAPPKNSRKSARRSGILPLRNVPVNHTVTTSLGIRVGASSDSSAANRRALR
jgi:hypothetical protein